MIAINKKNKKEYEVLDYMEYVPSELCSDKYHILIKKTPKAKAVWHTDRDYDIK